MAFDLLTAINYLHESHRIELGFLSPSSVFHDKTFKLADYASLYLNSVQWMPEKLEDLLFKPPEYFLLAEAENKQQGRLHHNFAEGKGEIWCLGMLLRFCMDDHTNSLNFAASPLTAYIENDDFLSEALTGEACSFSINAVKFAEDIIALCSTEMFCDTSVYLETPYL